MDRRLWGGIALSLCLAGGVAIIATPVSPIAVYAGNGVGNGEGNCDHDSGHGNGGTDSGNTKGCTTTTTHTSSTTTAHSTSTTSTASTSSSPSPSPTPTPTPSPPTPSPNPTPSPSPSATPPVCLPGDHVIVGDLCFPQNECGALQGLPGVQGCPTPTPTPAVGLVPPVAVTAPQTGADVPWTPAGLLVLTGTGLIAYFRRLR